MKLHGLFYLNVCRPLARAFSWAWSLSPLSCPSSRRRSSIFWSPFSRARGQLSSLKKLFSSERGYLYSFYRLWALVLLQLARALLDLRLLRLRNRSSFSMMVKKKEGRCYFICFFQFIDLVELFELL